MTILFVIFCLVMLSCFGAECGVIGSLIAKPGERSAKDRKWIMFCGATCIGSLIVLGFALMTYIENQTNWSRMAGMDEAITLVQSLSRSINSLSGMCHHADRGI